MSQIPSKSPIDWLVKLKELIQGVREGAILSNLQTGINVILQLKKINL